MTAQPNELDVVRRAPHANAMPETTDIVQGRLVAALQAFLRGQGAVQDLRVMADGHAGLTFGFSLRPSRGAAREYILKKAPEGVPRSGSTDVYRQVGLLRALSRSGFPAPDVPWASDSDDVLGAPFIIMERLPGRSVIVWAPEPASTAQFADPTDMWTEAARLMGALHAFDWRAALCDWQAPTNLSSELERWTKLLRHTEDEVLRRTAKDLSTALRASMPAEPAIALLHGDLQPGNVLCENGRAQGLIDWDLASIGPVGMDVGWLLMIADAEGWAPDWRPYAAPSRVALLDAYRAAGGAPPAEIDWHQAFAFFRMAAITGLNLKLHRDGRRRDPIWEHFATAAPYMLRRAHYLLQHNDG